jgi:hypothetical protein
MKTRWIVVLIAFWFTAAGFIAGHIDEKQRLDAWYAAHAYVVEIHAMSNGLHCVHLGQPVDCRLYVAGDVKAFVPPIDIGTQIRERVYLGEQWARLNQEGSLFAADVTNFASRCGNMPPECWKARGCDSIKKTLQDRRREMDARKAELDTLENVLTVNENQMEGSGQ